MNPITSAREIAAAGMLLASYPLEVLTRLQFPRGWRRSRDTVILAHGLDGDRTNLLAFALALRLAGFDTLGFFEYPARQALEVSAAQMAEMGAQADGGAGVHLIGRSLGGPIARMAAARSANGGVRSLVTIGSPYAAECHSPSEVAIFGAEDPIVPPPRGDRFPHGMFKRMIVLRNTGHLGVLYHERTVCVTLAELAAHRAASRSAQG
ncbi:MAG TPA: alpha/beta hydrolase [Candidatus Binataceae bacterium]|nr:alpha/beta hydrolase [Candidatus Binataceae bacterium]